MEIERKEDLSVYYFLKGLFTAIPAINVQDGFPELQITLPTVAVESEQINVQPLEMGNPEEINIRMWIIDVFAINKSQRDELAYKIKNELDQKIPVYDFDLGFDTSILPVINYLRVEEGSPKIRPIQINPLLVDKMYYRARISFTTKNVYA